VRPWGCEIQAGTDKSGGETLGIEEAAGSGLYREAV
jgi:hypothetical protein